MLRLRTSTGLSLLALAIGVAGTGWLSTLTSRGSGIVAHHADASSATARVRRAPRGRIVTTDHTTRTTRMDRQQNEADDTFATPPAAVPELVPLTMPGDTSQPWYRLRGHMDGRVLVHVDVDGGGRVTTASVVASSGDPLLDEHALRSVRGWRFAVTAAHPDGISGKLPMRFSSSGERVARLP